MAKDVSDNVVLTVGYYKFLIPVDSALVVMKALLLARQFESGYQNGETVYKYTASPTEISVSPASPGLEAKLEMSR